MTERALTLVGLTQDRKKLVLVDASGAEFTLPADAKLRAALRGDATRLGQLEIDMESALRPRDIQARIRAGESPEEVAAAAQTTVDRIMGFATPVLAERAHIAERAQRASVRRRAGEGASRQLGDCVSERLKSRNIDPESVEWDAWRRDDGRWTLVADYHSGESARHAEFTFDAPGRYVVAEDEEARWLVGERSAAKGPQPRTPGGRRLSAVGGDEDELPLGEDALELVTDQPTEEPTEDLTGTVAAVREAVEDPTSAGRQGDRRGRTAGGDDWMGTQAEERPVRPVRPVPEPAVSTEQPASADEPAAAEEQPAPGDEPAEDDPTGPSRRPVKKNRGRASVPSWDEIMFGGGKSE
jgi:hypothetical protein